MFKIDPEESEKTNTLVLRTQAPVINRELRQTLIEEELKYLQKNTGRRVKESEIPLHVFHVSFSKSLQVLKIIAGTGKLFFKERPIICDFFGTSSFHYTITPKENHSIEVRGYIRSSNLEIPLEECDFLCTGSSHWFIKGMQLKLIESDLSWKEIKKAFQGAFLLADREKQHFLEENSHLISSKISLEYLSKTADPLPILRLKDRSGAFADLWMDYGNGKEIRFQDAASSFKRNSAAEKSWEKDLLETGYAPKIVNDSYYYCPTDKITKSLQFLLELGWVVYDWKNRAIILYEALESELEETDGYMVIKGRLKFGKEKAQLHSAFQAAHKKEKFLELSPEKIGLLPESWDGFALQGLLEGGELFEEGIKVQTSCYSLLEEFIHNSNIQISERLKSLFKGEREQVPPSSYFKGELRPYQQEGLNWMHFLYKNGFCGLLADEMGLGKTVQTLAFISTLHLDSPFLVVAPSSLLFNWKREFEKFLPSISVAVYHGKERDFNLALSKKGILTSYATLRQDRELFKNVRFHSIFLDEAQNIKNPETLTAQAIFSLRSRFRLSITGTPIENSLDELWSHFHFIIPELLGSRTQFYAQTRASSNDFRFLTQIKKKIAPFLLRRKKEEVAKDLPERIDQIIWVEMEEAQKRIYEDFIANLKNGLLKKISVEGVGKHRLEILEAILRLRQICCHPVLISEMLTDTAIKQSAKFEALAEDLEIIISENRKVIVYSQFTGMLSLMKSFALEKGWKFSYLDGQTKDRERAVDQFQNSPDTPLFFISLKAGGVGLNLTAADYVLLYDPWWNQAVEEQAINRAHRIGRQHTVIAKKYLTLDTIEEKMDRLKQQKYKLSTDLFDQDSFLTEEDLLSLFE